MSNGRHSTSASLQSSVGATSAEELAEKYQKLFSEFSRIKAQHSVLKKAVVKEQANNASLHEECKAKEQELRTSLQQLDLLTFHNQRLTKRIESLQDSNAARMSPGWLVGSAKKELERSKITLDATRVELAGKIEENEKLHRELYEVNGLYMQRANVLQSKISELEKKTDELQVELTRSHLASEEALSTIRQEKRELDNELDQTRAELRRTKSLMEKNEQKLKEGDGILRAEIIALRETLSINLGLSDESHADQFSALRDKIDNESNEIIESFMQLQSSAREYMKSLNEKSGSSYELGLKVKKASQVWQQNLQALVLKLATAQSRISELIAEKENLTKSNEIDSNRVANLEKEISRLKEELDRQKASSNGHVTDTIQHQNGLVHLLKNEQNNNNNNETNRHDDGQLLVNGHDVPLLNEVHLPSENGCSTLPTLEVTSQRDIRVDIEVQKNGSNVKDTEINEGRISSIVFQQDEIEDEDDDSVQFVYPGNDEVKDNLELSNQPIKEASTATIAMETQITRPIIDDIDNLNRNGNSNILVLERDIGHVAKSEDDAKQRELLIKKHFESKICQLTEQLQKADSKSVRLHKALKMVQSKLADFDNGRLKAEQENIKLKSELAQLKEVCAEGRENNNRQVNMMTEWVDQRETKIKELEDKLKEFEAGVSRHE